MDKKSFFSVPPSGEWIAAMTLFVNHGKYKKSAAQIRGEILNITVQLEILIDKYISFHFCGRYEEKRLQFLEVLIESEITLFKKIKICNKILNDMPEKGEYKFERVKEYLENIRSIRNIMAHSDINSTDFVKHLSENTAVFKKKDKKNPTLEITKDKMNQFLHEVSYCIDFFNEKVKFLDKPLPKGKKTLKTKNP